MKIKSNSSKFNEGDMKILYVTSIDTPGGNFSGLKLCSELLERDIDAKELAYVKYSKENFVTPISSLKFPRYIKKATNILESLVGLPSTLSPISRRLLSNKLVKEADIIHFHVWYDGFLNLRDIVRLSQYKHVVLTAHDFWILTGHCIHPYNCTKYLNQDGCQNCPFLHTPYPLLFDGTHNIWNYKKELYKRAKFDIVVGSQFLLDKVRRSPLLGKFNTHYIPFGIDLNIFKPLDTKESKIYFGIDPKEIVISFRETNNEFKGLKYIVQALSKLNIQKNITILTFDKSDLIKNLPNNFHIKSCGSVKDPNIMAKLYNACDIFLMPSLQESFGFTAIEAMACGKPVICFEGTSLPGVIHTELRGGVVVPSKDSASLSRAISRLINNPEERKQIGDNALEIARNNYGVETYVNKHLELYKHILCGKNIKEK